jgi:uncharacterized membrane protein (DUF2068 family)
MSDEQKNPVGPGPETKPKKTPTLYFIVAVKFIKGVAALLFAVGAYNLSDNNLSDDFHQLLLDLHIDPEKRFFMDIADRLNEVTAANLHWVTGVSAAYGLFMLLQAVGLACRWSWAVWLVIIESGFFIPIEVMDLIHKHVRDPENPRPHLPKIGVLIVLAINVAIVWYLYRNRERIIRHHEEH